MRVLLVNPPRRYWPYVSEGDNFQLPQALPALAAVLRDDGVEVRIVDCMPLHLGWRSLAELVRRYDPDVVGCGENHALYVSEALRFFRMCQDVVPRAVRVAGGAHFTHLARHYLGPDGPIHVAVVGEGEITFRELVRELGRPQPDLSRVEGIAWCRDGQPALNPPRPLVADLDSLPMPAYDLVPMDLYGTSRYLFGLGSTTIHHSRGCASSCSFCAWWTTMADRRVQDDGSVRLLPRWRTRSPERVMEEIRLLHDRYGKRSLVFVDESWNLDPAFNESFADAMIRSGLKIPWFAFFRADAIVRDERLGILEKLVRAGLAHICVGVERAEDSTLRDLAKPHYVGGVAEEAIRIFHRRYPQVFLQATFLVGVEDEDRESLARQEALARRLDVDFPAFHPITPVPGTPLFDQALGDGRISLDDFDDFDWMTPILDTRHMSRDDVAMALYDLNRAFASPRWLLRGLASPVRYRRDMYLWFAMVSARMAWDTLKRRLNPLDAEHYHALLTPEWYET